MQPGILLRNCDEKETIATGTIMAATRKATSNATAKTPTAKRWSKEVTAHSNSLDLEPGVFAQDMPAEIARSLKHSADTSKRRKASPFQSAMSMLNLYINRAGKKLPDSRKKVLQDAKDELRRLYGR
jgi:Protein of unknown function (DUF3175)